MQRVPIRFWLVWQSEFTWQGIRPIRGFGIYPISEHISMETLLRNIAAHCWMDKDCQCTLSVFPATPRSWYPYGHVVKGYSDMQASDEFSGKGVTGTVPPKHTRGPDGKVWGTITLEGVVSKMDGYLAMKTSPRM